VPPDKLVANYHAGVLRLEIPVAEKAKPRKISVNAAADHESINAG
jgi:HSP20 family protein